VPTVAVVAAMLLRVAAHFTAAKRAVVPLK
jgi:hypothetical protein